jgi:hypothetical protein
MSAEAGEAVTDWRGENETRCDAMALGYVYGAAPSSSSAAASPFIDVESAAQDYGQEEEGETGDAVHRQHRRHKK